MTYRLLPPAEFDRLKEFVERNGVPMPNPETSFVAVAEKNGEIVYCHMAHLQLHLDNQCKDKEFSGYMDFRRVYAELEKIIPKPAILYTYPTFENGIRMAEICGFHKAPFPTMIKELR